MENLQFWESITSIVTQVITAGTAVIMAYLGWRTYLKTPEQEPEIEPEDPNDKRADEQIKEILVFKTSKQKTILNVSRQGLECRIEDTREGKGGPQWVLTKEQAQSILNSKSFHVNPGYKVNTGTFTLGPRRNWLYTKSLFPDPDYLKGILKKLLERASK